ncbi:protein SCO1/2 [Evansella vedderi]|uniref:Protein SCO1/2 n=1 Tax=Evansella vedderi TaxID=38282 RepID=A0ABT9ZXI6_9BACI|nr:SCO family protein [Evansella vedderi]MDQ0255447.1 protein SCO1/2 [Evansella vedderi]
MLRTKNVIYMGMFLILLQGCSFLYQSPEPPQSNAIVDLTREEEPWMVTPLSGLDENGDAWSTEDMSGEWWLAKTIFTRCPTVCMTMTPNMVTLQEALAEEGLDVKIVSFTVDPEFDTPERMERYGEAYGASFDNWQFISGYEEEEITEFAAQSFKATVMKIPEQEDILHSTRFFLMNRDGQVVRLYNGESGFDLEAYIEDLTNLLTSEN